MCKVGRQAIIMVTYYMNTLSDLELLAEIYGMGITISNRLTQVPYKL